jgi:hypothetical protein
MVIRIFKCPINKNWPMIWNLFSVITEENIFGILIPVNLIIFVKIIASVAK